MSKVSRVVVKATLCKGAKVEIAGSDITATAAIFSNKLELPPGALLVVLPNCLCGINACENDDTPVMNKPNPDSSRKSETFENENPAEKSPGTSRLKKEGKRGRRDVEKPFKISVKIKSGRKHSDLNTEEEVPGAVQCVDAMSVIIGGLMHQCDSWNFDVDKVMEGAKSLYEKESWKTSRRKDPPAGTKSTKTGKRSTSRS